MKYLRSTIAEMKKVIWPKRPTIVAMTALVVVISFLVAYYLGAFDYLFQWVLGLII